MKINKPINCILAWSLVITLAISTGSNVWASADKTPEETQIQTVTEQSSEKQSTAETESESLTEAESSSETQTDSETESFSETQSYSETEETQEVEQPKAAAGSKSAKKEPGSYDLAQALDGVDIEIWDEAQSCWVPVPDDYQFDAKEDIKVTFSYTLLKDWKPASAEDLFFYQIPDELNVKGSDSGYIKDGAIAQAGKYSISEGGYIEIQFLENYVEAKNGQIVSGTVSFEGNLDIREEQGGKTTVNFGEIEKVFQINPETIVKTADVLISKENEGISFTDDKTILTYNVTVTAPATNTIDATEVIVKDSLAGNSLSSGYINDSFKCNGGAVPGNLVVDGDNQGFTWEIGTMKPGDSYVLNYQVEVDTKEADFSSGKIKVINHATVDSAELENEKKDSCEVELNASIAIVKTVKYDSDTGKATYTIKVTAGSNNPYPLQNVVVTDVFTDGMEYVLSYDMKESGIIPNLEDKTFVWNVGTLDKGESKSLTYEVDIDQDIWLVKDSEDTDGKIDHRVKNSAAAIADGVKEVNTSSYLDFKKTWVKKGGEVVVKDGVQMVKYTVTVNDIPRVDLTGLNAVFKDTITSGNAVYYGDIEVSWTDGEDTGTDEINASGETTFSYQLTGKRTYTFVYYAKLKAGESGNITISNEAGVGIGPGDGEKIEHTTEKDKVVPVNAVVKKSFLEQDGETAKWKSEIPVTVNEDTVYTDYLELANSITNQYIKFDEDSVSISFDDEPLTLNDDYSLEMQTDSALGLKFIIKFKKEFKGTEAKPVTITYQTKVISENIPNTPSIKFVNSCIVENKDAKATGNASYTYYPANTIEKDLWYSGNEANQNYDAKEGTITWKITVNANGRTEGNVYIREKLPEGLEVLKDKIELEYDTTFYSGAEPTFTYEDNILEVKGLKIDPSLTADSKAKVKIKLVTKITDPKGLEQGKNTFINKVELIRDNEVINDASKQIEIIVENLEKSSLPDKSTIDYTILVNKSASDLGVDSIGIVDQMGEGLTLDVDTLKVYEFISEDNWKLLKSGEDYTFTLNDNTGKAFTLELPNEKYLKIEYTTIVSGKIGDEIEASNIVSFIGYEEEGVIKEEVFEIRESNATSYTETGIYLTKRDLADPLHKLSGAEFGIAPVSFDESGNPVIGQELVNQEEGSEGKFITDADGNIFLGPLTENVVYCYWEKNAPDGYLLDATIHYFAIENTASELDKLEFEFQSLQGGAIVYKFNEQVIDISGTKHWNDNENLRSVRPANIKVTLYAYIMNEDEQGNPVKEEVEVRGSECMKEVMAADNWAYTFKGVAKYHNNKEIIYQVREDVIPEQYEVSYDENSYDMTNTYLPSWYLFKTDADGNPLANAKFKLVGPDGTKTELISGADGMVRLSLAKGTYTLTETESPEGYILLNMAITFTVNDQNVIELGADTLVNVSLGNNGMQIQVVNEKEAPDDYLEETDPPEETDTETDESETDETEETETEKKVTKKSTTYNSTNNSTINRTTGSSGAKTSDNTQMRLYVLILIGAVTVILGSVHNCRKSKK